MRSRRRHARRREAADARRRGRVPRRARAAAGRAVRAARRTAPAPADPAAVPLHRRHRAGRDRACSPTSSTAGIASARRRAGRDDRRSPTLVDRAPRRRSAAAPAASARRRPRRRSPSRARGAGATRVVVTIDPAKRLANTLGLEHLSNTPHEIPRDVWDPDGDAAPGGRSARADARHRGRRSTSSSRATRATRSRRSASSRTASTATSPARSRARRSTWRWRSCTSCTTRRLRPHRRRHAADPPRARLPRRAAAAHAAARQPRLPHADGADPHDVAGRRAWRRRRSSARSRVSSAPRSIDDVVAFFRAFEGMEAGFRDRAAAGDAAARAPTRPRSCSSRRRGATRWKRRSSSRERLADGDVAVDALIVNRVHPPVRRRGARTCCGHARSSCGRGARATPRARLAARYENLADFEEVAGRERRELAGLEERIGDALGRRTCPSSATTCTTSPRSGRSPTTCWPWASPPSVATSVTALPTASFAADEHDPRRRRRPVGPRPGAVGVHRPRPGGRSRSPAARTCATVVGELSPTW